MKLKVHDVNLSTGGPLIVILNKEDASKLDIFALDRLKIKKDKKELSAVVDIAEDTQIHQGFIGVFEEIMKKMDLKNNELINVEIESRPKSINIIKKKLKGATLTYQEFNTVISDILKNKLSEVEIAYFVSACYTKNLTLDESTSLTKAIVSNSNQLKLNKKIVVDKHSVSGICGNRTTPIVVSIIASTGLTMPKTSSRAITSPSGTADMIEVLAPVSLSIKKIKEVVKKTNACIVWGGTLELASADDRLIKIEHPLSLDPEGILLSSIMAKKKAVNATHVLIDIPYGKEAKIETKVKALHLQKKFTLIGRRLGMKVKAVLTKSDQPIGNGIGPALEAIDVLNVLAGNGPEDLRRKSIFLANEIFKMLKKKPIAQEILDSGKAYKKFIDIIKAQGGCPKQIKLANYKFDVLAEKKGKISYISNKALSHLARIAGAPQDKKAGIYLHVKLKDKVKKEQLLFTIYAENSSKLEFAKEALEELEVMKIS